MRLLVLSVILILSLAVTANEPIYELKTTSGELVKIYRSTLIKKFEDIIKQQEDTFSTAESTSSGAVVYFWPTYRMGKTYFFLAAGSEYSANSVNKNPKGAKTNANYYCQNRGYSKAIGYEEVSSFNVGKNQKASRCVSMQNSEGEIERVFDCTWVEGANSVSSGVLHRAFVLASVMCK